MPSKIQGAKRQEVIEKWLNGEDDPDWQVNPTKTAGKYIIRPRKHEDPQPDKEEQDEEGQEQEEKEEDKESDEEPEEKPKKAAAKPKPKPKPKPQKIPKPYPGKSSKPVFSDEYAVEILNELKSIGELKRQKVQKREQKKLVKNQIRKHIPAPPPRPKEDPEFEYDDDDYDFDIGPPEPPLPQRCRVSLRTH